MNALWQDLRLGARVLMKRPGFTLIATLTLALGIGVTTAMFSVVNGVLLRRLPYGDEARVVVLWQNNLKNGVEREETSPANFFDWRDRAQSLDIVSAAEPFALNLSGTGEPETFRSWIVTAGFFDALNVTPLYGRTFLPEEYEPGKGQVIVIGYGLWQRRFGGDPNLVGRQLTLNGQPHTVVGILPPDFQYPPGRELWAPRQPRNSDRQVRGGSFIRVVGRLRPGRAVAEAQAEMNNIAAQLAGEYPQTNAGVGVVVATLREAVIGQARSGLLVLFVAVGFVLLIACANVASLWLSRMTERSRELAIRAALGAGRWRILRQLFSESALLALLGGAGGVLLAYWLVETIVKFGPRDLPRLNQIAVNPPALGFAVAVSLLTALIFGLAPAAQMLRQDLQESLKAEGRTMTGGRRQQRLRNLLVISEIALALALLVGAGLLTRSFIALLRVDPGFTTDRALALETLIGRNRNAEQRIALVEQTLPRIQSLPGVQAVGITSALPFHDNQVLIPKSVKIEGRASTPGQDPTAYIINVTPEYLRALGVPLLRGRELNRFDKAGVAPVAMVNSSMAVRNWPAEDPIGKKITFDASGRAMTCEIVGVVGDVRPNGLDTAPRLEIYLPYAQAPASLVTWIVRTAGDPLKELTAIKEKIREGNPTQTFLSIATMDQMVDRTITQRRFNLMLLGSFAALALILAAVGLYGLISYTTAQRTHEIGIRIALGAQTGDVMRLVIGQGIKLALVGALIGIAGALAVTRLMRSLLFGVSAIDPLTFVVVAVSLILVALAACWLPARRATKVDPLTALRDE
ncbi:MAG TPA: ABC transporter permease [Blastocatellia bacterium]|nr:ABC transporter permease [Blastocatellia bacterium]